MTEKTESRRRFLHLALVGTAAPLFAGTVQAQDLPHLDEADPTAAALGYRHDTAKVDKAKYPAHAAEQICTKCNLVQGKDDDAWRPCAIFPGKSVSATGWCAAWVKKVV